MHSFGAGQDGLAGEEPSGARGERTKASGRKLNECCRMGDDGGDDARAEKEDGRRRGAESADGGKTSYGITSRYVTVRNGLSYRSQGRILHRLVSPEMRPCDCTKQAKEIGRSLLCTKGTAGLQCTSNAPARLPRHSPPLSGVRLITSSVFVVMMFFNRTYA